jgi:type IV pilus assembly protein PilA
MKKQSGFTLIELLLVLAIIGIISAIAIPALLGQRARARDKSAVSNLDSVIADIVGQWDKGREAGASANTVITNIGTYVTNGHSKDKNPWDTGTAAYSTIGTAAGATVSAFATAMGTPTTKGLVNLFMVAPAGSAQPGFVGGTVLLDGKMNGSTTYKKVTAIE